MPDKKYNDQNIRKLTKIGKASLGLTLPKDIIAKLRLRERQKVKVSLKGRTILIRDWRKSANKSIVASAKLEALRVGGRK
jgi:antitoxin component of MazEF toxin-antitoxin module